MSNRRRKLIENYEDARLALLLDEYAEAYGNASKAQYERDLAAGKVKKISEEEAEAQLDAILRRAEKEEAKEYRIGRRFKGIAQKVITVAASIAIFFFLMLTVQATGIDVFGAVGRWTASYFFLDYRGPALQPEESANESPDENAQGEVITEMLRLHQLLVQFAPSVFPEGYSVSKISNEVFSGRPLITVILSKQNAHNIVLVVAATDEDMTTVFPKNDGPVETYISHGKSFHIIQNSIFWNAVWSDNVYMVSLSGFSSREALIETISSIK